MAQAENGAVGATSSASLLAKGAGCSALLSLVLLGATVVGAFCGKGAPPFLSKVLLWAFCAAALLALLAFSLLATHDIWGMFSTRSVKLREKPDREPDQDP